jgi:hypothetical protein
LPCIAGMEILVQRGLLWTGTAHDSGQDVEAWILADDRQRHARRLDGKPWAWQGAKSWTRAGSDLAAPLGLVDVANREAVAIVEGGPDLLAAASLAFLELGSDVGRVAFIASMSASQKPSPVSIAALRGKAVRLIPHVDETEAGRRWAVAWIHALEAEACRVDVCDLRPLGVNDLNELAPRYTEQWTPPDDEADAHTLPEPLRVFENLIQ